MLDTFYKKQQTFKITTNSNLSEDKNKICQNLNEKKIYKIKLVKNKCNSIILQ